MSDEGSDVLKLIILILVLIALSMVLQDAEACPGGYFTSGGAKFIDEGAFICP